MALVEEGAEIPFSATGLPLERRFEGFQESVPRPFHSTESRQMAGFDLAIDEIEIPDRELANEGRERDLRGIRGACEHRLPEKRSAERDPVQTPNQFPPRVAIAFPGLDRMGETKFVQSDIGLDHLWRNPGSVLTGSRNPTAGEDDFLEGRIHTQSEGPCSHTLGQTTADVKFVGPQDQSWIR